MYDSPFTHRLNTIPYPKSSPQFNSLNMNVMKFISFLTLALLNLVRAAEPSSSRNLLNAKQGQKPPKREANVPEGVKNFASGVVGGLTFVYSGQPLDKIKTLMQTAPGEYNGVLDCLRKTFRKSGIRGLYAGATATLAAECMVNASAYSSFQAAKGMLIDSGVSHPLAMFMGGGMSGVIISLIYTPFDLIKIRLQTQQPGQVLTIQTLNISQNFCSTKVSWIASRRSRSVMGH